MSACSCSFYVHFLICPVSVSYGNVFTLIFAFIFIQGSINSLYNLNRLFFYFVQTTSIAFNLIFCILQEFLALGFPTLFPKSVIAGRETEARFDLTHLVNGTYEFLRNHNQQVKARDDLEAKYVSIIYLSIQPLKFYPPKYASEENSVSPDGICVRR